MPQVKFELWRVGENESRNLFRGLMRARFVMCITNKAYPVSLTLHKVYKVIPDARGEKFGDVRIVDDSGEDYLFPEKFFVTVTVPEIAEPTFELEVA